MHSPPLPSGQSLLPLLCLELLSSWLRRRPSSKNYQRLSRAPLRRLPWPWPSQQMPPWTLRYTARAMSSLVATRRALWLRSWNGEAGSHSKLVNLPFEGGKLFGKTLDPNLVEAKDKCKGRTHLSPGSLPFAPFVLSSLTSENHQVSNLNLDGPMAVFYHKSASNNKSQFSHLKETKTPLKLTLPSAVKESLEWWLVPSWIKMVVSLDPPRSGQPYHRY